MDKNKEIIFLKIRSLITDKEHINQRIINDIAKYGQWQCDYSEWYQELQKELDEGFKILSEFTE